MDLLNDKNASQGKLKALEMAEDSRQTDWTQPSFVAELFKGNLRWDLVFPFPDQSPEDKKIGDAFLAKVEAVLKEHIDPDKVDETGEISKEAVKALADIGCFALKIPKKYNGLELSQINYNRVNHLVASYCSSTAVLLSAHQSIGVPKPLMSFGSEEQKQKYLPKFREGWISAFALTEPDVGSDPAKMKTTAVPTEDGKHFVINGDKLWCTNGVIADVLVVMAVTPPKIINGREKKQITAFIVETDTPGFEVVHRCRFMGLHGIQNGLLRFKDVKVPRENIIWGEGKGLKLALSTLNTGRLTMPAGVTGASKFCLRVVREWANEREQWGSPIGEHEAIAHKIGTMSATVFAMEAMWRVTAAMADSKNTDIRLEAAIAKLCCTEASWRIIDGAIQIRGGRGYETAPSLRARGEKGYALERLMRDARINTIIEGTSQIMRLFIAREAMDMHIRSIMPIMSPKTKMGDRLGLIAKAIGFYGLWFPKQFFFLPKLPEGINVPPRLAGHLKFISRSAHYLARDLFISMMLYQQKLEKKQRIMAHLVNIGTDLFSMASTCSLAISRYEADKNDEGPLELADLFCRQTRRRVRKQFRSVYINNDALACRVAKKTLNDQYSWLESDITAEL